MGSGSPNSIRTRTPQSCISDSKGVARKTLSAKLVHSWVAKAMKHTHYCEYSSYCDKKIDCTHDEYCPVFQLAAGLTVMKFEPYEDRGEFSMDQFWEEGN